MRQGAAAAAMLLAAGCGAPAPPPARLVTLSTQNRDANVAPVVAFFRRTCLENSSDNRRFAEAVTASGWPLRRENAENEAGPSVWRFDHGELLQSAIGPVVDCILSLDSLVAPSPAALRAGLRALAQRPGSTDVSTDYRGSGWAWPGSPGYRTVLTITAIPASPGRTYGKGRQAMSVRLSAERVPAPDEDQE
jgi:hypothetical protein